MDAKLIFLVFLLASLEVHAFVFNKHAKDLDTENDDEAETGSGTELDNENEAVNHEDTDFYLVTDTVNFTTTSRTSSSMVTTVPHTVTITETSSISTASPSLSTTEQTQPEFRTSTTSTSPQPSLMTTDLATSLQPEPTSTQVPDSQMTLELTPRKVVVEETNDILLKCVLDIKLKDCNTTAIHFKWMFNNTVLDTLKNSTYTQTECNIVSEVQLSEPSVKKTGNYSCTVWGKRNIDSADTKLKENTSYVKFYKRPNYLLHFGVILGIAGVLGIILGVGITYRMKDRNVKLSRLPICSNITYEPVKSLTVPNFDREKENRTSVASSNSFSSVASNGESNA